MRNAHTAEKWRHDHLYVADTREIGERRTLWVVGLTIVTMIAEVVAGFAYNSMALLADGWHMGTHAAALGITLFAYAYARRHAGEPRYTFGTGKVSVLGGFASAMVLLVVAALMAGESAMRLMEPVTIAYERAMLVAAIGLVVNLVSARLLLVGGKGRGHGHAHGHGQDHNIRGAYLHVLADAVTSVAAIVALLLGMFVGWWWMDPLIGIVGAAIIGYWAVGLLRDTSRILLDGDVEVETVDEVRDALEADADNVVSDIHVWRVGPAHVAVIATVVTHHPQPPDHYKRLVADAVEASHVTIEVHPCAEDVCPVNAETGVSRT